MTRRDMAKTTAAAVAAGMLPSANAAGTMPRRMLGKTGVEASLLGIGTAPLGWPATTPAEVDRVVGAAIDEGINYFDTAPIYDLAELRLGKALKGRRDKIFLVSKVEATSKQDALWQIRESLQKMQTDYLDAVHIHNVGRTDRFPSMEVLLGEDGALAALREAKQKGMIRHIGMTSHLRPPRAMPVLETGAIELVMCAVNFVDRHTYNFEGTVFAEAQKRSLGIVAMKILGGTLKQGVNARLSAPEHYDHAVRYALGIPGLSVAIMGMCRVSELQKAVATVRAYRPLGTMELTRLEEQGRGMAREWGPLRGPVA